MFKRIGILFLLFALLIPVACSKNEQTTPQPANNQETKTNSPQKVELMISAAASLKDAMDEIKPLFENEQSNVTLSFNFGSSGKLAQQIEQGAPSDVFLSASTKDMDTVQSKNLIEKDTRVDFAKNELVLITNIDSTINISSFEEIDPNKIAHFAIGEPKSVPAGNYTQETFQKLNLWNSLQNKLVMGSDVRQVLNYVETGNAELGVVYSTDALISKKVKILAEAKPEWHKSIVYPGAVITNSSNKDAAKAFVSYLTNDKGKEILKKYGFK